MAFFHFTFFIGRMQGFLCFFFLRLLMSISWCIEPACQLCSFGKFFNFFCGGHLNFVSDAMFFLHPYGNWCPQSLTYRVAHWQFPLMLQDITSIDFLSSRLWTQKHGIEVFPYRCQDHVFCKKRIYHGVSDERDWCYLGCYVFLLLRIQLGEMRWDIK